MDLGTTNCALAYFDTGAGDAARLQHLPIPQVVHASTVEERPLLPSFLYLPGPNEQPAGSLNLPWDSSQPAARGEGRSRRERPAPLDRDSCVGEFARNFGSQAPTRLVSSAKSWLCHPGVDRRQPLLPWKAPENGRRVSPVEASTHYLRHLVDAWNHHIAKDDADHRLENQDIILTVPASFDAVARELTVEAAKAAGLDRLTLLEEPQAAFYHWLETSHERWREQVEVGDVVLVCDIGGGTTDLSLIAVSEEAGQLALTRVAVGDHILLGGDNMDLALAHHAAAEFAKNGIKLDQGQMHMLWHACRQAKETLFSDVSPSRARGAAAESAPVTVLGRGSKVIGGTIKGELSRGDVERVLIDGFFPRCPPDAEPQRQRAAGLQEIGLPYAADPAVSKHLAQFLARHKEVLEQKSAGSPLTPGPSPPQGRGVKSAKRKPKSQPTAVLFNGGVLKSGQLRGRMLEVLNDWNKGGVRELPALDLDRAVAAGAAYYGLVRRGRGIRIRGGAARSYYIGIESSLPAVPGAAPPLKALCVVPFGMEEGTEADMPKLEFGLVVGEPAVFRFLGSTQRRNDTAGLLLEEWHGEIEELAPLTTTLEAPGKEGRTVPVHLHSKVTEVGTLELWCHSRDSKERWKLEFNVRERADD